MDRSFETGLASLSRYIHEKELLVHIKNGEIKPLQINSVETEVRDVWKNIKDKREENIQKGKEAQKKKYLNGY